MVMAQRIDVNTLVLQGITSVVAGGGQELAYRNGDSFGFLTTAAAIAAGIALKMFGGRDMAQFSDPIFLSGASVAGWQLSKQLLERNGTPAFLARRSALKCSPQ